MIKKKINKFVATAIWVKTESSDNYLYCVIGKLSEKEVDKYLKTEMGEEFDYICDKEIEYSK